MQYTANFTSLYHNLYNFVIIIGRSLKLPKYKTIANTTQQFYRYCYLNVQHIFLLKKNKNLHKFFLTDDYYYLAKFNYKTKVQTSNQKAKAIAKIFKT